MSDHSFNPFIAQSYSVNIAIFINTMIFWTRTNAGTNNNFYDGRYWTFGTPEFYAKYFPYFKPRLIKDIIQSCLDHGLILKGNYNKKGYDRTNWYALSDKALDELRLDITCLQPAPGLIVRNPSNPLDVKRTMHCTDYVRPIPDTKPDTKTNIISASDESHNNCYSESDLQVEINPKPDKLKHHETNRVRVSEDPSSNNKSTKSDYFDSQPNQKTQTKSEAHFGLNNILEENIFSIPEQAIVDWIANRKKKRAAITPTAWKKINQELSKCKSFGIDPIDAFETFVASGWQSFKIEWILEEKEGSDNKNSGQSPTKDWW